MKDDATWTCHMCVSEVREQRTKEELETKNKIILLLQKDLEILKHKNLQLESENITLQKEIEEQKKKFRTVLPRKEKTQQRQAGIITTNRFQCLENEIDCELRSPTTEQQSSNGVSNSRYKWNKLAYSDSSTGSDNKEDEVVVIGDSIIKHVKIEEAKVKVFKGIRAEQIAKIIESNTAGIVGSPKVIVLNVGTNNLKGANTPDEVMGEIYSTVRCIKKRYTKSKVFVNGVCRRRDVCSTFIDSVNESVRWACNALKCIFVDINKHVNEDCIGRDGLHLNRKGSYTLGNLIRNVVNLGMQQGN